MEISNLNRLETRFFKNVLNAELNVPVRATLEYGKCEFEMIVVPEVDEDGYFILRYFDASACEPETQIDESGVESKSLDIYAAFGQHSELKRAWVRSDPVTLQLHTKPVLFDAMPRGVRKNPKLDGRVQLPDTYHKGTLRLGNNQVTVEGVAVERSEFCIVGFPDFRDVGRQADSASESLPNVVLETGDGCKITLAKDAEQTRGAVSHTGVIEKEDGGDFGTDELVEILDGLTLFLSFAVGAWCYPTVVIGYNSENRAVWGEIGRFNRDRQQWPTWFEHNSSSREGGDLEGVFPRFWRRWKEKGDEITAVIQCYVLSHRMRETGLMGDAVAKSYAGLEMLASLMLGKTISKKPAPKINKVLCENDIPNCHLEGSRHPITTRLCQELELANNKGAYLLNEVRNYITHPLKPETAAKIKRNAFEQLDSDLMQYTYLYDLSQFYLEYLFLRFCNCDFNERSRLLCEEREALIVGQAAAERTQGQPEIMIQASERSELPVNDKGGREDVGLKEGGPKEWPPKVESSCKPPGAIKSPQGSNAEPPQQSKPSN